jgi:hypothetical protein
MKIFTTPICGAFPSVTVKHGKETLSFYISKVDDIAMSILQVNSKGQRWLQVLCIRALSPASSPP